MTAASVSQASSNLARPRTLSLERVTSGLFFTTLFVSTFEKVHWNFGGQLGVNDMIDDPVPRRVPRERA